MINDRYTQEKQKGGRNSNKRNHLLIAKVQELCLHFLSLKKDIKKYSALQLSYDVAIELEKSYPELLSIFNPYAQHKRNQKEWIRPTFYKWCNSNFKEYKKSLSFLENINHC